jgi:hypothetical protein
MDKLLEVREGDMVYDGRADYPNPGSAYMTAA